MKRRVLVFWVAQFLGVHPEDQSFHECFEGRLSVGILLEGIAGDLWHVKQRVVAAKAGGMPSLRFRPLWHWAQAPLS
jgi:hypothetical protein